MLKKLLSPSFIFVVIQAGVGALHYVYQLLARQLLSLEDFGAWSVWFAQFALTLLVATWVQALATLDGPAQPLFRRLFRPRLAIPILLLTVALAGFAQSMQAWVGVTAIGWFWACLQGIVFGRALARGRLILISVVLAVAAVVKLGIPAVMWWIGAPPEQLRDAVYAGVVWGVPAGLWIAFLVDREDAEAKHVASPIRKEVFATSLLLAIVTAAAPQFDLLAAGHLLGPEDLGRFGSVALVYKAFFFLILIFAQLLISKQVQAGGGRTQPARFLPVVGVGALIALGAWFFFPARIAPAHWVALGVLHISTLTFLFLVTQTEVSRGEWKLAASVVGLWSAQFALAWALTPSLENFYLGVLVTDALLMGGLFLRPKLTRGVRPGF